MQLLVCLPVVQIPFRFSGVAGAAAFVIIPNVPGVCDAELHLHVGPFLQLLRSVDRTAAAGTALQAADLRMLKDAMPSFVLTLMMLVLKRVS